MQLINIKIKNYRLLIDAELDVDEKQLLSLAGTIPPKLPVITVSTLYCKEAIFHTMIILCQSEKISTTCFCSSWRKIKL